MLLDFSYRKYNISTFFVRLSLEKSLIMPSFSIVLENVSALIQPGKVRFTLTFMSLDYLHDVLA